MPFKVSLTSVSLFETGAKGAGTPLAIAESARINLDSNSCQNECLQHLIDKVRISKYP